VSHLYCVVLAQRSFMVLLFGLGLLLLQFTKKHPERFLSRSWHYSVAEQPQLVDSIVTGRVQPGITHPTGKPISVSTQRGFSLPGT